MTRVTINRNSVRTAVLFALLLLPVLAALVLAADLAGAPLKKAAYLGMVTACLLLPAAVLKARTYFIAEGILNFLLFPIDVASLWLNGQSASMPFLEVICHTNAKEAAELLVSMWPAGIAVVALWAVYFALAFRVENRYIFSPRLRIVIAASVPAALACGLVIAGVFQQRRHSERSFGDNMQTAAQLVGIKFYKIYPYNLYIHSVHIMQKQHRLRKLTEATEDFSFGIRRREDKTNPFYVLVIGEASRYDHWGLNGYGRNTTPCLSGCSNLIMYEHVYAPANRTDAVIPLLLTRATIQDPSAAYSEKSLPEAFKEAGFRTGYISKQTLSDFTERISTACDYHCFYGKGLDADNNYDAEMLEQLESSAQDTMQFYVLHSLGSHFRYEQRYPADFGRFGPVLGRTAAYSLLTEANKDKLINAYDNTILYTDFFLHSVIEYLAASGRPAVLLYVSDHGESFWDDSRKLCFHSSYYLSEAEFHVPLLVWYSDAYLSLHPEKAEALRENRSAFVSSDVVFNSLLDIAGIDEACDPTRSIASPHLLEADTLRMQTGTGKVESRVRSELNQGGQKKGKVSCLGGISGRKTGAKE